MLPLIGIALLSAADTIQGDADLHTLTVVPLCDDVHYLGNVQRELTRALEGMGWVVRSPTGEEAWWTPRVCGKHEGDVLAVATALALQGEKLFEQMQYAPALKQLQQAIERLEQPPVFEDATGVLRKAMLLTAWAQLEAGTEQAALKTMQRMVNYWPTWQPDPTSYSPRVMTLHQRAKKRIVRGPTAKLFISSEPTGATASIDATRLCTTPCTFEDLPPGSHVLSIRSPGYSPSYQRLDLPGGSISRRRVHLKRDWRSTWALFLASAQSDLIAALPARLESERVVIIGSVGNELRAATVGPDVVFTDLLGADATRDGQQLAALIGPTGEVLHARAVEPLRPETTPMHDPPVQPPSRRWVWPTAITIAVTVVGSGLGIYFTQRRDELRLRVTP